MRLLKYWCLSLFLLVGCTEGSGPSEENSSIEGSGEESDEENEDEDEDETGEGSGGAKLASTLALPNITNIIVSSSDSSKNGTGIEASSFYGVDDSGTVGKLAIFESSSTNLTTNGTLVASRFITSKNYNIFVYSVTPSNECKLVIHRKSDQKLFCAGDDELVTWLPHDNALQFDDAGNFYYRSATSTLVKITLEDPDNPTRAIHYKTSEETGNIDQFIVTKEGDVLVVVSGENNYALIKKSNGGIQNVSGSYGVRAFIGADGAIYWVVHATNRVNKLVRESDGTYTPSVHNDNDTDHQLGNLNKFCEANGEVFGGLTGNLEGSWSSHDLYSFYATPGRLELYNQNFATWNDHHCSDSHVFVLGTNDSGAGTIQAFKVADSSWQDVVSAGAFTIYNFAVNRTSNTVYFNGLRNSDGAKIYARVDELGQEPVIMSSEFFEPEALVPLN